MLGCLKKSNGDISEKLRDFLLEVLGAVKQNQLFAQKKALDAALSSPRSHKCLLLILNKLKKDRAVCWCSLILTIDHHGMGTSQDPWRCGTKALAADVCCEVRPPYIDCLSSTSHRCLTGLRSGEIGSQVNTLNWFVFSQTISESCLQCGRMRYHAKRGHCSFPWKGVLGLQHRLGRC